jgi:cytoskeletal protein RodZ
MSANSSLNLASVRKSGGLTLEEIARSTHIAPSYLNAIESEDFGTLPGGVYDTSYIRQYARAIGFGEAELLDRYHALKGLEPAPVLTLQQSSRPKTRLGESRFGKSMAHWLGHLTPKPRTQHPA